MIAEELLIDFCELVRKHSGENLAHAIYNTLNIYSLKDHVIAINADNLNTSNNDTMVEHLATLLWQDFINFSPLHAQMRCMPYTVHLAALEVCRCQIDYFYL
ncbi:hypothetical protein HD554DRAFT_2019773 [Boletus coccyginus]|nr:hypothetical protein HD554DRAFT_2019773 [Boletus coccyginus]